jgi:hypothetical protein
MPARMAAVPTKSPTHAATTATPTDKPSIGQTSGLGLIVTSDWLVLSPVARYGEADLAASEID